jgi:hypothetical protein
VDLGIRWSLRDGSGATETVDLLNWYRLADATGRAKAVLDALESAENETDLDDYMQKRNKIYRKTESKREGVMRFWSARASENARIATNLSRMGIEQTASLVRHGYVLAMAKLHLLSGYPLCEIPTWDEFKRMAEGIPQSSGDGLSHSRQHQTLDDKPRSTTK